MRPSMPAQCTCIGWMEPTHLYIAGTAADKTQLASSEPASVLGVSRPAKCRSRGVAYIVAPTAAAHDSTMQAKCTGKGAYEISYRVAQEGVM